MTKKALILGGTGAMGVFLTRIISEKDNWTADVTTRSQRENFKNINYVTGNARDRAFMKKLLSKNRYDVIVDFMNYGYEEFADCHNELLNATDHYIFLSSSRVYANSETPITENSARLLDVSDDAEFLATQRYALRKARQENMLSASNKTNYTIIRPYITYSPARLQLGIYEKEHWLYRVLHGKSLLVRREILENNTSLTYGFDVADAMFRLMEAGKPEGEAVHIVTPETMKWKEILKLYSDVIENKTGIKMNVLTTTQMQEAEELFEGGYNTKYDRLYDRCFNSDKAENLCGSINYMKMKDGLISCLSEFLDTWKKIGDRAFLSIMWDYEAYIDKMTGQVETNKNMPDEESESIYFNIIDKFNYNGNVTKYVIK